MKCDIINCKKKSEMAKEYNNKVYHYCIKHFEMITRRLRTLR